MEHLWEGFTIPDGIKDFCGSWEEVNLSILTGVWKTLTPNITDVFEGLKTSVQEVTADVVKITRGPDLEVEILKMGQNCCILR